MSGQWREVASFSLLPVISNFTAHSLVMEPFCIRKRSKMENGKATFQQRFTELLNDSRLNPMRAAIEMGIPQTAINGYLSAGSEPTVTRLIRIADFFGVSTDYLTGRTNDDYGRNLPKNKFTEKQIEMIDAAVNYCVRQNEKDAHELSIVEHPVNEAQDFAIYFIFAPTANRIKIGFSKHPEKRVNSIMTSSPFELELLGVINGTLEEEQALHQRFSHLRAHREWFEATPELRAYIAHMTRGQVLPELW